MDSRRFLCSMSQWVLAFLLGAALLNPLAVSAQNDSATSGTAATPTAPPVAPIRPETTDYYGMKVVDPYRYIENLKDPQVDEWFKGQNAYARGVLAKIPGRDALLARIRELDASTPAKVRNVNQLPGERYFYEKMLSTEIISRLYIRDGLNGQAGKGGGAGGALAAESAVVDFFGSVQGEQVARR